MDKKIDIDFYGFFKTGEFAGLKFGLTKAQVLENFPVPDGYTSLDYVDNEISDIWNYGNIELHFYRNELSLIFSDYIQNFLDGGTSLTLNKWILENPENLSLIQVISELNQNLIDFTKVSVPQYGFVELLIKSSQVVLTFLDVFSFDSLPLHTQDINALKLISFALKFA